MDIQSRAENGVEILELAGRFDAYEVASLTKWLDAHQQVTNMVINLGGVGFIDSSGLAALVKSLKRCRQNGGELHLCNLQQAVRIIFELTQLDKAFMTFATEQAALQSFVSNAEGR